MIRDAAEAHYLERWGKPSRRAVFRRGDKVVDVLKWDSRATGEGVTIYATIGASPYPMSGMPVTHRIEYYVGLNPERDDIAGPLAGLALYAFEQHVVVGHGDTVPAGMPLWPGSEMSTFLVIRPVTEILPPIRVADDLHVDFLQVIPVYASEVAFKARSSAEELLEHWRKAKVPFWNPERLPEPAAVRP